MKGAFSILIFLGTLGVQAQSVETTLSSPPEVDNSKIADEDTIYVIGSKEKVFYTPGSATFIDSKELEKFQYNDVSRVLDKVPGVYIQEEDGMGLRPNIGLRGAHPHRSKKITLMEDGILVGPAPYAAPAAYYFPSTSRFSSMEVFKGPSAVQYGPNSVGGAINMVTKPLSGKPQTELEVSAGTWNQLRLMNRGQTGAQSWLIEVNRKQGDLLKELPSGKDIDFQQNDVLFKLGTDLTQYGALYGQKITTKFSFATEDSDETYLGLSPGDFNSTPFTRYAASEDDNIQWDRWAAQASYTLNPKSWVKTKTTVYHHQMRRNWYKFNDLFNRQNFRQALRTGNDPQNLIPLLRGDRDSADTTENLLIGANDRSYYSQGIQTKANLSLETGSLFHELSLGVRVHRDQVTRNHQERQAKMIDGSLQYLEGTYQITNRNQDTANALAVFAEDEIIYGDLSTRIGARVENVQTKRDPRTAGSSITTNENTVFVPGIGFNYSLNANTVVLAGVNKGVTMVGPGQANSIDPEVAINYELGMRLKAPVYLEAIAFYSDYQNLKGSCSFSSGCSEELLDTEFNGGEAEIYGLESIVTDSWRKGAFSFPWRVGYTFTVARFKNSFSNSNPEWGPTSGPSNLIRVNDPLPYIPQNQITLGTGVAYKKFSADINLLWKDQVADQSVAEGRQIIPSYGVIDTAFSYDYSQKGKAFVRVNNVLDNTYLTSLRPFGARPGSPRTVVAGFTQRF